MASHLWYEAFHYFFPTITISPTLYYIVQPPAAQPAVPGQDQPAQENDPAAQQELPPAQQPVPAGHRPPIQVNCFIQAGVEGGV